MDAVSPVEHPRHSEAEYQPAAPQDIGHSLSSPQQAGGDLRDTGEWRQVPTCGGRQIPFLSFPGGPME